ncbi:MAG: glycosyltransferase family 2 protein [Planctomycetota bacterium]|jgi:GT2 family glycosyltransferase
MRSGLRVSLVIPTLNAGPLLEEVLQAVARQPDAAQLERVAVDSGSTDDTVARLQAHGFTVHQIDKRDFNHGATRDLAIGKTQGDVILLLTQDATPLDENWLPTLLATYDDPAVGAAYCRQVPRDDCNPFIKQRILEWAAGRPERVVQRLDLDDPGGFENLEPMQRLELCAYDNVAGSVRRSAWEQHKFGHRNFGEDVAFGKKLVFSGHSIVYEPKSAVIHSHNRSPKEEGKRIYCDHVNLSELFGLQVLPTWKHCRQAIRDSRKQFAAVVDGLDVPPTEKGALHQWARQYAKWSALGIYLGGNRERLCKGVFGWCFHLLDKHLRRGI